MDHPEDSDQVKATEGTFHFMSPEECDPDNVSFGAKAIDVWALGVTMFCMLFKKTPFWGETEFQIMENIRTQAVVIPEDVRPISCEARELLTKLLKKDFKERITIPELMDNPWLRA
jgi:[calcium/calmodulin-dependent protein kinase] kinase